MTTKLARVVPCLLLCWLGSARADAPLQLTIAGADVLPRTAHTTIAVYVTLPAESADLPLALSLHIDGEAIELVRGRLLRADAKSDGQGNLEFSVPVVARSPGAAILRVELMTYACDPRCRRVDVSRSRALRVR